MSTLERSNEIEADFYRLKAQEWACEPEEAELLIASWCNKCCEEMMKRRLKD